MQLDRIALEEILLVTCCILEKHFYYDQACISRFLNIFSDVLKFEINFFDLQAEPELRYKLKHDKQACFYFTIYFVSAHMREILIDHLYFSELELIAFDNLLPKYSEVNKNVKPCSQRAHY
jgi:hypothetical protein